MRRYRAVCPALLLLTLVSAGGLVRARERGDDILAAARHAAGIDASTPIARLSLDATLRRRFEGRDTSVSSDIQLRFVLPDKYLRVETLRARQFSRTSSIGVNGGELLFEDGGLSAEFGVDPRIPGPRHEETIARFQHELFRFVTVWLLSPPADGHCTASYVETVQTKDGRADVVEIRSERGRNLRLFIDVTSHRLLRATYEQEVVDPDRAKAARERLEGSLRRRGGVASPEDQRVVMARLDEEIEKLPKKTITAEMRFSRHRAFGSVILPETMVVEAGRAREEWKIVMVTVNPPPDPSFFGG